MRVLGDNTTVIDHYNATDRDDRFEPMRNQETHMVTRQFRQDDMKLRLTIDVDSGSWPHNRDFSKVF